MRRAMAISAGGAISVAALIWASSFIADVFDHQPALGDPVIIIRRRAALRPVANVPLAGALERGLSASLRHRAAHHARELHHLLRGDGADHAPRP